MRTAREPRFTSDDYLRLPAGFPAVLVEGALVREPAPTWGHQWLVLEVAVRLRAVVGSARVLTAPADVALDRWNVLQPDVLVLPPETPLSPRSRSGPLPVLVVEVLSPETERRDRETKTRVYLRAGVCEVWLVDPRTGPVDVCSAAGTRRHAADEVAESDVLPGFRLTGAELLAGP
jgi:Uma2 family endonuclease